VEDVTTLDAVVTRAEAPWRLTMWMFVLFAALAFALAILGLFSVVALDVAHSGRELAIRLSLGASRGSIVWRMVLRAGWRVSVGIGLGLFAAVATGRAMRGLLFGIAPHDAATYAAVLIVVLISVGVAAYVPARRAARTDPNVVLRQG
jgi:putative ABC transport system permease protein